MGFHRAYMMGFHGFYQLVSIQSAPPQLCLLVFKPLMNTLLVGGLEHDFFDFPYIGNSNPN